MQARTKRILGAAVGLGLALAVAIAAVVIPGYQALRPALDPATVWVANGSSGQVAAANTQIEQLQDVTRVSRGAMRMEQDDEAVLLVDATNGTLRAVDPATGELATPVPIPPNADVQVRGEHVLVSDASTGDIRVTTVDAVREGQPIGEPVLELGRGTVAVLGESKLFAASPGLARVVEYDFDQEEAGESHRATISPTRPSLQITAIGDNWVLYDSTSGTISTRSWNRQLDFEDVQLQQPSESSGSVVFATHDAIVRATVGASAEEILISGMTGQTSPPLVRDGCVYGVWSDGTAWNGCVEEGLLNLRDFDSDSPVRIQARGSAVIVTDSASGSSWSLHGDGAIINDWLEPVDEQLPEGDGQQDYVPETDEEVAQQPPVAEDDEFGARAGQVTVLPVTRNDSDPNNDPLIITEVSGHDGATVTPDGQSIRLDLEETETGTIDLRYTLTDGRGGEDSANVTVTLSSDGENSPPVQLIETSLVAQSGGMTSIDVLADWVDPDGDPLTLVSVTAETPDQAIARPDGRLELHDGGAGGVRRYIVTVSDGVESTEGTVTVSTTAKPQLTAEPITVSAIAGQTLEIEPLLSARGGDGEIRLHNVELPSDLLGEVAYDAGTVRLTPADAGDMSFPYVVTDGTATQQGMIRVLVAPEETASAPPLPLPEAITLPPLGSTVMDLASLTADPAGGSLVVTSLESDTPALRATLADLGIVHLELTAPLEDPATVSFTLSNGTASAQGTIAVSEGEMSSQAPIARDDTVRAAPGQAVTIFPLANDEHPDMGPVELLPDLVSEPEDGVMFTRGDTIVFLAPDVAGSYEGVYEVEGPDGQRSTATVTVAVGATGGGTNQAPEAPRLHARVMAGQSVDITVPLAGSDPNGDPVQLLGPSSTASLGTLSRLDGSTFRYTAGDYSSGTDEIRYLIADDRGAQAEGTLTIAVAAMNGVDARPRAISDTAEMLPDTSLAVDVLSNDTDAANLPLTVTEVEVSSGDATADVHEGAIVVQAGAEEGEVGIVYVIENSLGEQSSAWLTVQVHEGAEPPRPVANDIEVPLMSVLDRDRVTVRPLQVASVADGRNDLLDVEIAGGGDDVEVQGDGSLSVPAQETAREFAYRVVRSDTETAAYGIVRVPGTNDSLPRLRENVPPIEVASGQTATIDINEYIVAATGRPVWITDASNVQATQGESVVRDAQTIEFTPTPGYYGPANISLEVTDGESPQDPDGRVGLVVLPISVIADESSPPTLLGTTFTLEPGESRTIDLTRITQDPANRPDRLAYSVLEAPGNGVELTQNGHELTMSVAPQAEVGTSTSASLGVSSGSIEGSPGTLTFSIVSSTRPLLQPATDSIDIRRGTVESLQPLSNDESTNPFPGQPLTIDQVAWSTPGVFAEVDGNVVTVAVSGDAPVQVAQVRYRVLDSTGQEERAVWGTIRVRIQDVPDRPDAPRQATDRFERNTLFVQVTPPDDNNSPLTALRLRDQFGNSFDCSLSGECTLRGLDPGVDYRFTAIATNEIGDSEPSQQSVPMQIDALPNPVTGVRAQPTATPGTMRLSWDAATVPSGGTPVNGYIVRVTGPGVDVQRQTGASARTMDVANLRPGETYTVRVAATNGAGVADDLWRYSDPPLRTTAVGRPGTTTVAITDHDPGRSVSVQWATVTSGGATPVRYTAQVIDAADQDSFRCSSSGDGDANGSTRRSAQNLPLESGRDNVVAVVADNGWFCSTSFSTSLRGTPGEVRPGTNIRVESNENAADARIVALPPLEAGHRLQVRLRDGSDVGSWANAQQGTFVAPGALGYGSSLTVELRQCVTEAGRNLCGPATRWGSVVPFDLNGQLSSTCRPGQALEIELPSSSVAEPRAEVEIFVNGQWEPWNDHDEPLPSLTQRVSVTAVVDYQGNTYRDIEPNEFECTQ